MLTSFVYFIIICLHDFASVFVSLRLSVYAYFCLYVFASAFLYECLLLSVCLSLLLSESICPIFCSSMSVKYPQIGKTKKKITKNLDHLTEVCLDAVVVVVAVDADDTVAGVDDEGDVRGGAVACGVDVCN